MPSTAGAIVKAAVKHGPKIAAGVITFVAFVKENPAITTWLREHLGDIPKRLNEVNARHGDAAKFRGMLEIIRDVARELDAHAGDQPTTHAATWLEHADKIELGVRLAEAQPRPEQKRTLARLRTETEELLAELLQATAGVQTDPSTESTEPESAEPESAEPEPAESESESELRTS
jgi:hypothetical protein